MSAVVGGRPNMRPLAVRGAAVGYSLRPHSMSRVGHGEAELKPGTGSSERSLNSSTFAPFSNHSITQSLAKHLIN